MRKYLKQSGYNRNKATYIVDGFQKGFDIGYRGPQNRVEEAKNLPFRIGNATELWNKIMKEVQLGRYAGPYNKLPFQHYIQSPIGLVPKAGNKTRLIFHLSYDFGNGEDELRRSVNQHTPQHLCSVKYNDLDHAIMNSLRLLQGCEKGTILYYSKTDCSSAFRIVPTRPEQRKFLCMKAEHPIWKVQYYFIDKCLPFGSSKSCKIFQDFSDCLKHMAEYKMITIAIYQPALTNYLDDFLFIAIYIGICQKMLDAFLELCEHIGCPIAEDKTVTPEPIIEFLGTLLNGVSHKLSIPIDKIQKARFLLLTAISAKKVRVGFIQKLTGTLNFLNRVVIPGRAFMRSMYDKLKLRKKDGTMLKQHHHVSLNSEFINDCRTWVWFLDRVVNNDKGICRPFIDFSTSITNIELCFYTDASKNPDYGVGAIFGQEWFKLQWPVNFIREKDPSIAFLELYGLTLALTTWKSKPQLHHSRIAIFCDNQSVIQMVNQLTSTCPQCMKMIRLIALFSIENNVKIEVKFVASKLNGLADSISRMNMKRFWQLAKPETHPYPTRLPGGITPVTKIWNKTFVEIIQSLQD